MQKSYWIEHTTDLSVEAMMLDSKAADLDKEERPEVVLHFLLFFSCFKRYLVGYFDRTSLH